MAQKAKKKSKLFISGVPDYPLLVITMLLLMFGLVMLLSASAPSSLSEMGTSYYYFWRQLMFAGAGLVLMIICMKFNYRLLDNKVARIFFYVLSLVMAASVLVFGNSSGGATRWVRVGPISFQPSEVIKLALILFYASYLPTLKERVQKQNGFWRKYFVGFLMPLIYLGVVLIAVFKFQNHLSVCVLVTAITCVQMFVSGVKIRQFVITLAVLAAVGLMVWGCYSIVNSMTETTVQEDAGFNFKVWAAAKKVMFINRAFLHYRQDNPNSSVKSDGKVYAVKEEYDEVERWLKERELYDEYGTTLVGMRFSSYIWKKR